MKKPLHKGRVRHSAGRAKGAQAELAVVYEDDAIVVVDKPAGLPAVPIKNSKTTSAWSLVADEMRSRRERAFVVHRIDRFTSGIIVFAKTERDRDRLVQQFLEHSPKREYLAVVRGHLQSKEATLVHYFRREGMFQKLTRENDRRGARAELRYKVETTLRDASLVRVTLVTGLQNQIRVQFSAIGHPVVGDRKYHEEEEAEQRISRVALHAAHLGFIHPGSGKMISFDSQLPADMRSLVGRLTLSRKGPKQ